MMSYVQVLLVLSIVAHVGFSEEITSQNVQSCRRQGYYYTSTLLKSCYRIVAKNYDWFQASRYCSITGGRLVALETLEEQAFLVYIIRSIRGMNGCIWTSGNEITTKHRWVWHGWNANFAFTHWAKGEPNDYKGRQERCMCLWDMASHRWNDVECHQNAKFICEKKM